MTSHTTLHQWGRNGGASIENGSIECSGKGEQGEQEKTRQEEAVVLIFMCNQVGL